MNMLYMGQVPLCYSSKAGQPQFSKHQFDKFERNDFCGDFFDWVCGPLFQRPFDDAMAALLVSEKTSIAATLMEILTKTNTLAKRVRPTE